MLTVTLYTRKDCHLCETAKQDLTALEAEVPHKVAEIDIDEHPDLWKDYFDKIPVIEVGPYRKFAPFTRQDLLVTLRAAQDRQQSLQRAGGAQYADRVKRGQEISGADKFSYWLSRHYMLVINLVVALYIGLPFLAPVLMKSGVTTPANVIYTAYSPMCHGLGFRSFFLFGQQVYYPRAAAGVEGVMTFEQATGILEDGSAQEVLQARAYKGDELNGYKVALCQRDVAIYGTILLFGLVFSLAPARFPKLPLWLWLLIGIGPIGLDGFSQLFSQAIPPLANIIGFRESTPLLRVLTGALFGLTTAWFGLPYVEESMRETRETLIKKFTALKR